MKYYIMREGNYIDASVNYRSDTERGRTSAPGFSPEYFPVNKYDVIRLSEDVGAFPITVNFEQKVVCIGDDGIAKLASYASIMEWNEKHKTMPVLQDDYQQTRSYYAMLQIKANGILQSYKSVLVITEDLYRELETLYRTDMSEFKLRVRTIVNSIPKGL